MKIASLLALSLGITIATALSLAQPIAIAAPSQAMKAPTLKRANSRPSVAEIVQEEAQWLHSTDYEKQYEALSSLHRLLVAEALEIHQKSHGKDVQVPSVDTIVYFGDLSAQYPNSVLVQLLLAESLSQNPVDRGFAETHFMRLIDRNPTHPLVLARYHNWMKEKHQHKLPAPVRAKLDRLYNRAIAQHPKNLWLYLDQSEIASHESATLLKAWSAAQQAMPNQPQAALAFGYRLIERDFKFRESQSQVHRTLRYSSETAIQSRLTAVSDRRHSIRTATGSGSREIASDVGRIACCNAG